MRTKQPPTLNNTDSVLGERFEHPAYGVIGCSRVSGSTSLVGSELRHNHYISLRIARASKYRSIHEDRFFGSNKEIIQVNMSEHQWASFVASMNMGSGVPCTIAYGPPDDCKIESKPELDEPNKHDLSQNELKEYAKKLTADMQTEIQKLQEMADSSGSISKTAFRDRLKALNHAIMGVCSNLPFHVDMHKEMMEKNVQAAKSDVEGYVTGMVATLGLESLRKLAPQLESPDSGAKVIE